MKSFILTLFLILFPQILYAQQIEISSSPNPVGSGARALGMGGAFISIADDATAASWNPGGLVQLKLPEVSIAGSFFSRQEEYSSQDHPEAGEDNEMSIYNLNYLSLVYPFTLWRRNMVLSLNHQRLYDFFKRIDFDYTWDLEGSKLIDHVNFDQEGGLKTLSPAYAFQITPSLSLGVTFNFWTDIFGENNWVERYRSSPTGSFGPFPVKMQILEKDRFSFAGFNFNMNIGFLWDINQRFTLGAVYKSPFTADLKRKNHFFSAQILPTLPPDFSTVSHIAFREDMELEMPMSYGMGLAVRFSDVFTMALDFYRTEWDDFILEDSLGRRISPVTGKVPKRSHVKATHQIRLGGEYLIIKEKTVIPIRAGIFYDPEPSRRNPEDYYGFSIGTGIAWGNLIFDAVYQFRFGRGVEGEIIGVPHTDADVSQHMVLFSVICHFKGLRNLWTKIGR